MFDFSHPQLGDGFRKGLCLGHWRSRHPAGRLFTYAPAVAVMSVAGGMLFLVRYRFLPANDPILYTHPLLNMATLAPLRLSYFAVWAYLLGFTAVWFPRLLIWRWPAFLGQHSLQVFTFHLILVYSALPFFPAITALPESEQALLTLVPLAMLTLPAYLHATHRRLRNRVPRPIPHLFHR